MGRCGGRHGHCGGRQTHSNACRCDKPHMCCNMYLEHMMYHNVLLIVP